MKLFSFLFVFCCPPFSASDRITSPPSDLSTYRYAIFRLVVIANRPKLSGKWSSSSQTSYPTLKEVTTFLSQIDHPYQPTNDSLFPNVVGFMISTNACGSFSKPQDWLFTIDIETWLVRWSYIKDILSYHLIARWARQICLKIV